MKYVHNVIGNQENLYERLSMIKWTVWVYSMWKYILEIDLQLSNNDLMKLNAVHCTVPTDKLAHTNTE